MIGFELEYSDVDKNIELPKGTTWDTLDYDIVNSNGWAVDPKGKLHKMGGEINTRPVNNVSEVEGLIEEINTTLGSPVVNYRSHLHIHISDDRLHEAHNLKKFLTYFYNNQNDMMDLIYDNKVDDCLRNRSLSSFVKSNQAKLPLWRLEHIQQAQTMEDIRRAFGFNKSKDYSGFYIKRYGVNAYSMFKRNRGTIEFRTFKGTTNPKEISNAAAICQQFVDVALTDGTPFKQWYQPCELPKQQPIDWFLEYGFQKTNHKHKMSLEQIQSNMDSLPTREEFESNKEMYMEGFQKWKA